MWPNPQFAANLVTFTEEILHGKLPSLCSSYISVSLSTIGKKSLWSLGLLFAIKLVTQQNLLLKLVFLRNSNKDFENKQKSKEIIKIDRYILTRHKHGFRTFTCHCI